MTREGKRQALHIALFVIAFSLKWLERWQAIALMLVLLLFVNFIFPRFRARRHFFRAHERRYSQGAMWYFLVLIILLIVFPLPVVAVSWAILALGDGSATLVGQHFRARELAWNRNKTYAGSIAFIIFGSLGALILLRWMMPELSFGAGLSLGLRTSIAAAIVESLPWRLNDNITVPLTSAIVLSFLI